MLFADGVSEDLMIAFRKRAEIESKYFVQFVQDDASELRQSLNRFVETLTCIGLFCPFLFLLYGYPDFHRQSIFLPILWTLHMF